ncbi:MAG: type I restriction endonuclease subunit R [Candidatus Thorarchaeota archaeon]|nr:type I restriction endonuclease subunit R [Candidatus Thorarchaeota archaeon]
MKKTAAGSDDYTEYSLVEKEAIKLFEGLGWKCVDAYADTPSNCVVTKRESYMEVILKDRLQTAMQRLNHDLPEDAIQQALHDFISYSSTKTIEGINQDIYKFLKDGIQVKYRDSNQEMQEERVRLIDWDDASNNDFLIISQLWVSGLLYTRRPDLVGFVNGIPLLFIELKAVHVNLKHSYDGNLSDYKDTIPQIFWYNGFIILSNLAESVVGTITSKWEHFTEWKKVDNEDEPARSSLETTIRGTCEPARFLDIVENFVLFQETRGGLEKIVARYHQYLGVNNAVEAVKHIEKNKGKLGVFWHTQGSGKSFSMVFFGQKVLRKLWGGWKFVVVTDRLELDDQISRTFKSVDAFEEPIERVRAQDGEHLKQLLTQDYRYVFTIIHKFRTEHGEDYPMLSDRSDIIVMTDEAHRTQYDILAENMHDALPNAAYIGFTGTPLMAGEEKTRDVFGDYVSIYNFSQSVEDKATVPLYYENRVPEVQLINESFDDDILKILEEAELDVEQEDKLEQYLSKKYHIITRDDRLETIAEDIVEHFTSRGQQGKAMVISIDKMTAVRMYEKVQKYWKDKIDRLKGEVAVLKKADLNQEEKTQLKELEAKISYMEGTDMAVVVSQSQGEIDKFRKAGFDITQHRKRIVTEPLDDKFKDEKDPLRIVFVCAMWITGFDAKPCSTIYLDKPMRNHTLMQTIARANRVFKEKKNGIIVDYIGIFSNLRKALSIYGAFTQGGTKAGDMPVKVKEALVEELREEVKDAEKFCRERGVYLKAIIASEGIDRGMLVMEAANAMLKDDNDRRQFLSYVSSVNLLFRAIKPDPAEEEFRSIRKLLVIIGRRIRSLTETADISHVIEDIDDLLDRSVATEPYVMPEDPVEHLMTDLSKIDFEKLQKEFEKGRKWSYAQRLRSITQQRIRELIRLNKTRRDYMKRLQMLIDEYNDGKMDVDQFFAALIQLAEELNEEEQRHVVEQLTEEELALFDILTKPEPKLGREDRELVKKIAKDLLRTLKDQRKLVLDWKKNQKTRAVVEVAIKDALYELPEVYSEDMLKEKCDLVYQHVYESYQGEGRSVYMEN